MLTDKDIQNRKYHCSALEETNTYGNAARTLCGLSTKHRSWDFPFDFAESNTGPAFGYEKCKVCEDHPDMPMALLGDLEYEI